MNKKFQRTVYSIYSFLKVDVSTWGSLLKEHHIDCMDEPASYSQRKAWFDCYNILIEEFTKLDLSRDLAENVFVIFEYELPRERGRRPDVLLLSGNNLIVLEFKGYSLENQAQIDQAKHYARDLRNYHEQSHKLNVIPVLVLAAATEVNHISDEVQIISRDNLHLFLESLTETRFKNINAWFESEYAPLPSLIQSAQLLFKENEFPQIKRAQSIGIPLVLEKLDQIIQKSNLEKTHNLALITGVPGAGKTLVGLQFVFEKYVQNKIQTGVFLSGNGPLVKVLQFSLGNNHFVQSVHGFLKQYAHSDKNPSENVIIYDEAQRAWDSEKVSNSRRDSKNAEPTDFINIGNRKNHCLLVGLIGEGQEIYLGEESGIGLWSDAVEQSKVNWTIHCPEKLQNNFQKSNVEIVKEFNLTKSLRTHQALTLQSWVENLLEGNFVTSKSLASKLFEEGYPIYVTRELEKAKSYVKLKYDKEPNKTFGLISSSKSKILPKYGVKNDYNSSKIFSVSQYYVESGCPFYCRNLTSVVTEFGCQGLELDMPILAWEGDWVYNNGWIDRVPNKKAKNSNKLRMNSYRVLLTRGRDGLIIFVPNENILNNTYQVLLDAGCKNL
ncbi:DNA/RNA helicase domain-containing protein [Lutibacter citreus]|uniref:DNA/RNA helicase domain-containing protein n=1 Tax=Lutibacter citreus TaxID=2138210 RepID=UPI000DBE1C42|nr:DNA/RNA helicase domain-containing protein [Lutibacter citreus]